VSNLGTRWATDVWKRRHFTPAIVRRVLARLKVDPSQFAGLYDQERRASMVARAAVGAATRKRQGAA
jgi:hypothetical protein